MASQGPTILLAKTPSIPTFTGPGELVTYTYVVTNTGNVTLTAVNVSDPMPGLSAVDCPVSTLAPSAQVTCTATYTTTQADVDAGFVRNTATATGTPPSGLPNPTSPAFALVIAVRTPAIGVVKQASIASFSAPGTQVTYTYVVTNTGNVTLHSVNVADPLPGLSSVTCPTTTLAPGQSESCTATYTTTQADVDNGGVTNTATVSGTPPTGAPVTGIDSHDPGDSDACDHDRQVGRSRSFATAGTLVNYTYLVTNSGNVSLTSVGVTDLLPGVSAGDLPDLDSRPRCLRDMRGRLHHDTGGRGPRQHHQHRHCERHAADRRLVTAQSTVILPAAQVPAIGLAKSADSPDLRPGSGRDVHLRGHQQRQRDAVPP